VRPVDGEEIAARSVLLRQAQDRPEQNADSWPAAQNDRMRRARNGAGAEGVENPGGLAAGLQDGGC
jgi:hypothetical protein